MRRVNVLMAAEVPSGKRFIIDLREAEGWVEVAEFESLQDAQAARDRFVADGSVDEEEIRVRGERGERVWKRLWMGVLGLLAAVNAVLYGALLAAD